MPTISSASVPPPKSWDEFEDITLSAVKLRWTSDAFFRNGRPGQKQDGVDIWGHDDDGRHIGIQCKNTIEGVSFAVVETELSNAETFQPTLDRLYIATTAKRDATLQRAVRHTSQRRAEEGKFKVDLLFWDDIYQDLAKDDSAFFSHYPQFKASIDNVKQHDKVLFNELLTLLSSDGAIGFIDRHNMAGFSFRLDDVKEIDEFYYRWNKPEREFINSELEAAKKDLWNKIAEWELVIARETFPAMMSGCQTVPPEWEIEQPERFHRVVGKLHSLAGEIVTLHADLVRKGRMCLVGK